MLHKSFIDTNEILEFLNWSESFERKLNPDINGYLCSLSTFGDKEKVPYVSKSLNLVRNRCIELIGECLREPTIKDFLLEIYPTGYISTHTDGVYKGYKHIRCNILLEKPKVGGIIIENGIEIPMDQGDMFILKTWLPHSVSMNESDYKYKSLVFGFLVKD